jgi:hypothetical protein
VLLQTTDVTNNLVLHLATRDDRLEVNICTHVAIPHVYCILSLTDLTRPFALALALAP